MIYFYNDELTLSDYQYYILIASYSYDTYYVRCLGQVFAE